MKALKEVTKLVHACGECIYSQFALLVCQTDCQPVVTLIYTLFINLCLTNQLQCTISQHQVMAQKWDVDHCLLGHEIVSVMGTKYQLEPYICNVQGNSNLYHRFMLISPGLRKWPFISCPIVDLNPGVFTQHFSYVCAKS